MQKRLVAGFLGVLLLLALFGCDANNASETPSQPNGTTADVTDSFGDNGGEELTFVYLCNSLTLQWCQDIADSLNAVAQSLNVKIIASDSGSVNDKYVTQVETYCEQKVDGFLLNTSEEISIRVDDLIKEAGIPYLFESTAPYSEDGELLVPGVELNGEECGAGCGKWLGENFKEYLNLPDDVDMNEVGFIPITLSTNTQFVKRSSGATEALKKAAPDFVDGNVFVADLVKQGSASADSAYQEVSAIMTGNPQVKYWLMSGVIDDLAQGGTRAAEAAGREDDVLVSSVGGHIIVKEWDQGYEGCWVMCNSHQAIQFSELLVPALVDIVEGKVAVDELWPEWVEEGQTMASLKITGTPAVRENYRVIRRGYPESENKGITGLEKT